MEDKNEVNALLNLIDDPDHEIYEAVSNRIITYGLPMIPNLEHLWETTVDTVVQDRIELLIHRLYFSGLYTDFKEWNEAGHHELMPALLLTAKFLYPELQAAKVLHNVERLRRNIWLEINNYLTPLEQVHIINSIIYNYIGIKGSTNNKERPAEYLIPQVLESKKGNQTGIGALYLLLVEMLDIPIRLMRIPHQFVLGYCKPGLGNATGNYEVDFFIEPSLGQIFTHTDLQHYLHKIAIENSPELLRPRSNREVIQQVLIDFSACFNNDVQQIRYQELETLIHLLD
ncbi:transglutaminase family protein [Niabella hirudinis]|uniref:transglutaminase family protein n=1 Tax=Niabella hirudinis TaxID=1285929 RepID=UPI003EB80098